MVLEGLEEFLLLFWEKIPRDTAVPVTAITGSHDVTLYLRSDQKKMVSFLTLSFEKGVAQVLQ